MQNFVKIRRSPRFLFFLNGVDLGLLILYNYEGGDDHGGRLKITHKKNTRGVCLVKRM